MVTISGGAKPRPLHRLVLLLSQAAMANWGTSVHGWNEGQWDLEGGEYAICGAGLTSLFLRALNRPCPVSFFCPLAFIERLAALVPPPRLHQLTYHGVLASASSWRSDIVPARRSRRQAACGGASPLPLHRYSFAELMKRVFRIDALNCAVCGSERRWIAAITSGEAITKILDHLELPSAVIQPSPPRAPPQAEFEFEGC